VPVISKLHIIFSLIGVTDLDKANKLIEEVKKSCIVGNSIQCEKTYSFNFS
jgi:uncharacterized OsmC-like protein